MTTGLTAAAGALFALMTTIGGGLLTNQSELNALQMKMMRGQWSKVDGERFELCRRRLVVLRRALFVAMAGLLGLGGLLLASGLRAVT